MLGARAGLKVSAEQLFRLSVLVQLVLSLGWIGSVLIQMWLRSQGAGTVTPLGVLSLAALLPLVAVIVIHSYHFVLISGAIAKGSEYPWDALKWSFLFATVAFCPPFVLQLVLVSQIRLDVGSLVSSLIFFLPAFLHIVLLWWPRNREVTAC